MSGEAYQQLSLGIEVRYEQLTVRKDLLEACATALIDVHGVNNADFDERRKHNERYGWIKNEFHDDFYFWNSISPEELEKHAQRVAETTRIKPMPIPSVEANKRLVPRALPPTEVTLLNWKEAA